MSHENEKSKLSRRRLVAAAGFGTAAALTGTAVGAQPAGAASLRSGRLRVVVVGGGIAGVATAWLLDGQHDVTLLEAASSLGGHAASVPVDVEGHDVMVDVGAQFFGPYSHPIYNKLVTSVLQVPTVPNQLDNTLFEYGMPTPLMVSPSIDRPITDLLQYLPALQAVGELMERARDLEARRDWSITVADLVEAMTVDEALKESFVYPYVASVNGATISQAKEFSARAALALAVRPLVDDRTEYVNARDGLQSVISSLSNEFTSVTTCVNTRAAGLSRVGGQFKITDSQGRVHLADQVVLALPPEPAAALVAQLPQSDSLTSTYNRFRYMPARIAIHRDPIYMPASPKDWSSFNITRDGEYCEASIFYGRLRGDAPVYKSWVLHRREEPKELLDSMDFRHPLITPDFIRAQGELQRRSGDDGLWFAGSHVFDVDSQESALYSALMIAAELAPGSQNRLRLGTLPTSPAAP
ncbi:FAD-dependent oxidoreductase [Streptomyces tauricus]|uniref:FAD-dependent oxidoreductase n=1 Tax=Streptomyces tauricus TaxID=68274 RepID=UPI002243B537|nr:FAD-dependent oxidoreductase [Streptomyces tauricus]MCW8103433.1 FAD-dependent oxidoreductase [Streptomyces tauricus]